MLVNEVRSHIIPSGDSGYGPGSSAAEIETEMERQLQVVVWCAERMGNVVPASTQPSEPKVHIHQELRLRLLDYNNSPCAGCPTAKSISYMCQAFKVLRSWCYSRLPHNPYPIKCILLDKSHKFEQAENFAFAKSLALFMVGIISAPYVAGTHFAGRSEWVWVMRESTVLIRQNKRKCRVGGKR